MIARIARCGWGPDQDARLEAVRDLVLPVLRSQPGYRGIVVVEDPATAEMTFTSYWSTEAELAAAATVMSDVRSTVLAEAQLAELRVDLYEVAVTVRVQPPVEGAWVRVLETTGEHDRVDAAIAHFRGRVIPAIEPIPGFVSAVLLVNRATTRSMVASVWESGERMLLSASRLAHLREEARVEFGTLIRRIWQARLRLADLRVSLPSAAV